MATINGVRVYGAWAGLPKGVPEDATRCIESVYSDFMPGGHQCCRKRGHGPDGLYCKQHGKIAERRGK